MLLLRVEPITKLPDGLLLRTAYLALRYRAPEGLSLRTIEHFNICLKQPSDDFCVAMSAEAECIQLIIRSNGTT